MKKSLIVFLLIICNYSFGQNDLINTKFKSGIYPTVTSIIYNRPISFDNLNIKEDSIKYDSGLGKMKYLKIYYIDITKKEAKKIGGIMGFSNGEDIFLTNSLETHLDLGMFYKAEKIGHFLYYYGIKSTSMTYGGVVTSRNQNILDFKKNELISDLTNSKIKRIISDNKNLLNKFKEEKKKYLLYKKYLKEYCE